MLKQTLISLCICVSICVVAFLGYVGWWIWAMTAPVEIGHASIDDQRQVVCVIHPDDSPYEWVTIYLKNHNTNLDKIDFAFAADSRDSISGSIKVTKQSETVAIVTIQGIPEATYLIDTETNTLSQWTL